MTISVDSQIELRQLRHSDAADIFNTIDTQRAYLGRWLPFVAFTTDLAIYSRLKNDSPNELK